MTLMKSPMKYDDILTPSHFTSFHALRGTVMVTAPIGSSGSGQQNGHFVCRVNREQVSTCFYMFLRSLIHDMIDHDRDWSWLIMIVHCTDCTLNSIKYNIVHVRHVHADGIRWLAANGRDGHDFENLGPQTKFSPFSLYAMAEAWRDNLRDTKRCKKSFMDV